MAGSPHQTGEAHGEVPSHAAHNGATKHGAAHRPSIFSKLGKDPDVIMTMLHTIFDELKDHTETIDGAFGNICARPHILSTHPRAWLPAPGFLGKAHLT